MPPLELIEFRSLDNSENGVWKLGELGVKTTDEICLLPEKVV